MRLVAGQTVSEELIPCRFDDPNRVAQVMSRDGRFTHLKMLYSPFSDMVIQEECPEGAMWIEEEWEE